MINLQKLRTFVTICECGTLAGAADRLGLTPSAVSIQVSQLEYQMGVRLFDRSHRPIRLTESGRQLANRTVNVFARLDLDLSELSQRSIGKLHFKIGAIPTILANFLPAALVRLRSKHPEITVHVTSGLSGRLLELVRQGDLDAAIIHKPFELGDEYEWQGIARQSIRIVAPPNSVESSPDLIFANQPYIKFHNLAWVAPMISQRFNRLKISPRIIAEIESIEAIYELVRFGLGASVLPVNDTGRFVPKGVRTLDFGQPALHRMIGMVSRADAGNIRTVKVIGEAFIDL